MSQLIDNLNTIVSIKSDIKSAIENKGVDMTGVSFPGYASKIGEISGGGTFVTETLNVSVNNTYYPGQGVDGFSQVVVDVPQSVIGFTQKNLTEGTIEIINLDNSASFVASSAFMNNKKIQTVNLPYATSVGATAFYECISLTQVSLPVCSYIDRWAFGYCNSLTQVSLPVCSSIDMWTFGYCTSLTQVSLPVCSYIGSSAFYGCTSLTQVSLPVCEYICYNAFRSCSSLSQVILPMCSYIDNQVFIDCYSLSQVSLPVCSKISNYTFYNCSSLSIITIGYSSVCSLYSSNTFTNTQITSSTGSIYVPASLVDSYKSATNWSYFSTQIFPIPE